MNYSKINTKPLMIYPTKTGYIAEYKVVTTKTTTKYKAKIYTICV